MFSGMFGSFWVCLGMFGSLRGVRTCLGMFGRV